MNESIQAVDAATYLEERVDDQLEYYRKAANRAKRQHLWIQTTVIVLGLFVPVLVNIPPDAGGFKLAGFIQGAVTVFSLAIAVLTGIANFRKFGDLWLSFRMTEELIKHEKYLFLTSSGKYTDQAKSFGEFVKTVESILSAEHSKFRSVIEDAERPIAPAAAEK